MSVSAAFWPAWPTARLWRRLAAFCYDLLLIAALLMVLTAVVLAARAGTPVDPQSIWFRLLLLVTWWAYFAWSWTHGGQTVGMRAWRLTLARCDGRPVGLMQASLRFAAAWVSALALGLGFIWSMIDRERLAWHDRVSGTELRLRPKSAQAGDSERRQDQ